MSFVTLSRVKYGALATILAVSVMLPFVVFGNSKTIHVDGNASGLEDGTSAHPYATISKALDYAGDGDEISIHDGKYKESITIPKGVTVNGNHNDRNKVVIRGGKNNATVTMKHGSSLNDVTVENGRNGIEVVKDARAKLFDVVVKDARLDGISADSAKSDKNHRLYAEKVEVKGSGRAGIFSESRYVVLVNCDIHDNETDGIDFLADTKAWLENVNSNDNGGSGWKAVVDGSEIWSRDNQFRRNGREGIQIESDGSTGSFGVKSSKTVDNGRWGIVLIARNQSATDMWKHVFLEKNSSWGNRIGNVSSVIRGY